MRLRTDDWWTAGAKRAVLVGAIPDPRETPESFDQEYLKDLSSARFRAAESGDVWRVVWTGPKEFTWRRGADGVSAGYVLVCPDEACHYGVHWWGRAQSCRDIDIGPCPTHGLVGTCWTWTGSARVGDLTASPSLLVTSGCGWHGFLRNGEMEQV